MSEVFAAQEAIIQDGRNMAPLLTSFLRHDVTLETFQAFPAAAQQFYNVGENLAKTLTTKWSDGFPILSWSLESGGFVTGSQ